MNCFVFRSGDILQSDAKALVNPVNCVGIMGAGLAKQFLKRFPYMEPQYRKACRDKTLVPGSVQVINKPDPFSNKYIVINFPTKNGWWENSNAKDITKSLVALAKEMETQNIPSVAIPKLGCGLGQLDWKILCPIIYTTLNKHLKNKRIIIYGDKALD